MFVRAQGEVGARTASCLALLALLACSGCGRTAVPLIGSRTVRVKIASLLPLHPAWQQVATLDQTIAQFTSSGAVAGPLVWAATALPTPLHVPEAVPAGLAKDRDLRVKEDARKYVAQVTQSVHNRAAQHFLRVERAERKRYNGEVTAETARREAALRSENTRAARFFNLGIRNLGFRDVALQSQIHVYTGISLQDAVTQRAKLQGDISALVQKRDALLNADVHAIVESQMAPFRAGMAARMEQVLKQDRDKVNARVAERITSESQRVNVMTDPIPPLGSGTLPPENKATTPLVLSDTGAVGGQGQGQFRVALVSQRASWQSQRDRLIRMIQADTVKSVTAFLRKRGWRLAKEQDSRAADVTGEVANAIRSEWRSGGSD